MKHSPIQDSKRLGATVDKIQYKPVAYDPTRYSLFNVPTQ